MPTNPTPDATDAFYRGFAAALLFAQAYNDVEGGQPTLTTHLPDELDGLSDEPFDPARLTAAIDDLNVECSCSAYRLGKGRWDTTTIEIASSEGHHGLPDWETPS